VLRLRLMVETRSAFAAPKGAPLQQKSKPRNGAREIFAGKRAAITRTIRLRSNWTRLNAQNMRQIGQIRGGSDNKNNHNINILDVGWGARIRTREWRNHSISFAAS
jgi:hypothetical protein